MSPDACFRTSVHPPSCCRNIHDDSLASSVQCTSVRLLLNLVEIVFGRRNDVRLAEQHRMLLGRVLDAFVSKLSVLQSSLPRLLNAGESNLPLVRRAM